jgi:hypothetical protein
MPTLLPEDVQTNRTFLIEDFFPFATGVHDAGGAP